ncbi:MAG: hypothetical protein QMD78_07610, partial [Methanocellales archaeon]|nr:hypothetical protein [Methanocellales archaeon]
EDWRSEEVWKKDLEFLDYLNKKGKLTIAWTVTYGTLPQGATKYQVAMYGFATYLMAKSGTNAYFCARDYEEKFYNVSKINVGYPLEEYHIRGDVPVYEREFSNVLVLLNPSDNNFTLRLGRNFTTLDGETVSEISLPAKSGIILLKYG